MNRRWIMVGCLLGTLSVARAAAPFLKPAAPSVNVELLAERAGIAPGKSVDLAVKFSIESEWHIYWQNRGEGGMEPSLEWKLPAGFQIGPVRYPPPRRHIDKADAHTFILEGEPVLLATLTAPADARAGDTITVGLDARWLVCKEVCKLGEKSLTMRLPVVASDAAAPLVNDQLFKHARADLPQAADRAKYLRKVSVVPSVNKVRPGSTFKLAVVVEVAEQHHINAHKVLDEFLFATDVFPDPIEGISFERPEFPPGTNETGPAGEKASVYRGRVAVILSATAEDSLKGPDVPISGVLTYQACNDRTKQCYAPTAVEWSLRLPVAAANEAVLAQGAEFFGAAPGTRPSAVAQAATSPAENRESVGAIASGSDVGQPPPSPTVTQMDAPQVTTALGRLGQSLASLGLIGYLLMAFVGGFILNLMPCVLPVISIKVLSFVQQARESRVRVFTLGLAFSSGILASFIVLGVLIVGLGQQWGGLFQMPQVVIGLCAVVTAFSLSLFGVFSLFPPKIVNNLGEHVQREGHLGAFGMGLLATVLGTACTAPFLSLAIAFASQQPGFAGMLIFFVAGVGMAFPYVLLALKPAWLKLVPRPGPWMETFEQIMGFALLATVLWLLNTVSQQLGGEGLLWTLAFLLIVAMAVWLRGRLDLNATQGVKIGHYAGALTLVVGGWWLCFHQITTIPELITRQRDIRLSGSSDWLASPQWDHKDFPWIEYTPERVRQAVESGRTVFVDYTAEWCANCKANEKVVINTPEVRGAMRRLGVLPFRADFTLRDPSIKQDLERYGRGGVPMYLIKPAHRPNDAIVLDELLTKGSVIEALEKAGPSQDAGPLTMTR